MPCCAHAGGGVGDRDAPRRCMGGEGGFPTIGDCVTLRGGGVAGGPWRCAAAAPVRCAVGGMLAVGGEREVGVLSGGCRTTRLS